MLVILSVYSGFQNNEPLSVVISIALTVLLARYAWFPKSKANSRVFSTCGETKNPARAIWDGSRYTFLLPSASSIEMESGSGLYRNEKSRPARVGRISSSANNGFSERGRG